MESYTIIPKTDWNNVPAVQMVHPLFPSTSDVSATAQVCYDESALYVRLCAVESNIRAEYTGLLDEVCEDSCLEFFCAPVDGDDRYFNLELNPNGSMYFGFGTSIQNLYRLIPETHPIHPEIRRTQDGWTVEYAVPFSFIRLFFPEFSPAPGTIMHGNFFKCGNLTVNPHWLCWSPVPEARGTFHCPEYFGSIQFA